MEADFRRLYPESYSASITGAQMTLDARSRWQNSLEALRTATRVQSQAVQNFTSDERTLTDLVNRSQSATGALQAMQATNQLLALQSRQALQAQQLQITQDRAAALEQARQIAAQERAREVRRRFQGDGTRYTPYTVNFYGN
jgi:P-type conjugative transfer protein TrbJ